MANMVNCIENCTDGVQEIVNTEKGILNNER